MLRERDVRVEESRGGFVLLARTTPLDRDSTPGSHRRMVLDKHGKPSLRKTIVSVGTRQYIRSGPCITTTPLCQRGWQQVDRRICNHEVGAQLRDDRGQVMPLSLSSIICYRSVTGVQMLFSPPGIAMLPAGLCFTDVTSFFKCRPCHSTTGGRIATRIVALTPSIKKLLRLKSR